MRSLRHIFIQGPHWIFDHANIMIDCILVKCPLLQHYDYIQNSTFDANVLSSLQLKMPIETIHLFANQKHKSYVVSMLIRSVIFGVSLVGLVGLVPSGLAAVTWSTTVAVSHHYKGDSSSMYIFTIQHTNHFAADMPEGNSTCIYALHPLLSQRSICSVH